MRWGAPLWEDSAGAVDSSQSGQSSRAAWFRRRGARRPHRSHADVRADVVDKRDGRAALVNEQLPFGTMSLAHQTFCQDRPAHCG